MSSINLTTANGVWGVYWFHSVHLSVSTSICCLSPICGHEQKAHGLHCSEWLEHKFDLTITLFQGEKMKGH